MCPARPELEQLRLMQDARMDSRVASSRAAMAGAGAAAIA